ncbi:MAG: diguanylate cyclase [Desulfobulbaceae bacterium]|uniref:diguanylate cyclase n=1 Tax=Candidatus Desulfatifera sulfidica TaxID=2841691 RepID=A0A8J6T979_9BACT|nr:diguanylate cyclase [Candidatus Desulfatifera sulfidica]
MNTTVPATDISILIVDDDSIVRDALITMLKSLGYTTFEADSGLSAIEILKNQSCDLVLSDIVMPHMNGMQLLAHIRSEFPNTDVIMATGYNEQTNYVEAIEAGAIDFIKKPIEFAELEAKLNRALRERDMVRRLEQLSLRDSLTGLLNRRAFDQRFNKETERASRQNYPLFLAMLDIDNFKNYNDTLGHPAGDKVLQGLAEILLDSTRTNVDMSFRVGGDEFALLMPQTSLEQAKVIIQRIMDHFLALGYGSTGLSIGLTSCRLCGTRPAQEEEEALIKRADKAMYTAKAQGKNQIVCDI